MAVHSRYQFAADAVSVHALPLIFPVALPSADTCYVASELHAEVRRNWYIFYLSHKDAGITVKIIPHIKNGTFNRTRVYSLP